MGFGAAFGSFVSGLSSGADEMLSLRKKADDLKTQLASNERLRSGVAAQDAIDAGGNYDVGTGGGAQRDFQIPGSDASGTGEGSSGYGDRSGGVGGWGQHAPEAIEEFKKLGFKDTAITALMAHGLAEGGFATNWLKSGGDEDSRGHWQLNINGERPAYMKWAQANGYSDPTATIPQVHYLAYRMNQISPGFGNITDPNKAMDAVGAFERYSGYAPNRGQRMGYYAQAQDFMSRPNYGYTAPNAPPQAAPAPDTASTPSAALPGTSGSSPSRMSTAPAPVASPAPYTGSAKFPSGAGASAPLPPSAPSLPPPSGGGFTALPVDQDTQVADTDPSYLYGADPRPKQAQFGALAGGSFG